jgi:hypothetical protein
VGQASVSLDGSTQPPIRYPYLFSVILVMKPPFGAILLIESKKCLLLVGDPTRRSKHRCRG